MRRSPTVIPWGGFKGRRLTSVPEHYLHHLARRAHMSEEWRSAAQDELVRRVFDRADKKKRNQRKKRK